MATLQRANLELISSAQQLPSDMEEDSVTLRQWLLTVQTRLGGQPVSVAAVAADLRVDCTMPGFVVECLGQADPSTVLYRVEEMDSLKTTSHLTSIPVRVVLVPRLSSDVAPFYRLDDRLASLVGRKYLVHPKYALTIVLAYARDHQLDKPKFLVCDAFLESLFNCKMVKIRALWDQIFKLMERVKPDVVSTGHTLHANVSSADDPAGNGLTPTATTSPSTSLSTTTTCTSSEMFNVDQQQNLFPADWDLLNQDRLSLSRSQSQPGLPAKTTSTKRTLKRHKTI